MFLAAGVLMYIEVSKAMKPKPPTPVVKPL
jgi:hypothetical protein